MRFPSYAAYRIRAKPPYFDARILSYVQSGKRFVAFYEKRRRKLSAVFVCTANLYIIFLKIYSRKSLGGKD